MIKEITDGHKTIGFVVRIELRFIEPPIWRLVAIPSDLTLRELHSVIQIAMGWTDSHLHQFSCQGHRYGIHDEDYIDDETLPEEDYTVDGFLEGEGSTIEYEYDFGDGWEHTIKCERVIKRSDEMEILKVLDGQRACPPEDCGGVPGYYELLETISDPQNEEYESIMEWLGGEFDPESYNIEEANEIIDQ